MIIYFRIQDLAVQIGEQLQDLRYEAEDILCEWRMINLYITKTAYPSNLEFEILYWFVQVVTSIVKLFFQGKTFSKKASPWYYMDLQTMMPDHLLYRFHEEKEIVGKLVLRSARTPLLRINSNHGLMHLFSSWYKINLDNEPGISFSMCWLEKMNWSGSYFVKSRIWFWSLTGFMGPSKMWLSRGHVLADFTVSKVTF